MSSTLIRAIRLAERRARQRGLSVRAVHAYYDRRHRRVILVLKSGLELQAPRHLLLPLSAARVADIADIRLSVTGYYVHWPRLRAYLWITELLGATLRCALLDEYSGNVHIQSIPRTDH